jgi:hypothetical protein
MWWWSGNLEMKEKKKKKKEREEREKEEREKRRKGFKLHILTFKYFLH